MTEVGPTGADESPEPSEARRLADRLAHVTDVLRAFTDATADYPRLLETIARRTATLLGHTVSIRLVADEGRRLDSVALHEPNEDGASPLRAFMSAPLPLGQGSRLDALLASDQPQLIADVSEADVDAHFPPEMAPMFRSLDVRRIAFAPMTVAGEKLGGLFVAQRGQSDNPLRASELALLDALAKHAALAIANARTITTLRSESEERLRRRAVILEAMSEALLVGSSSFVIEDWNAAAERLFGWTAEEAIGKDVKEILPIEGIDRERARKAVLTGKTIRSTMRVMSRRGDWLDVQFSTVPLLTDGTVTGFVSVMQDVTERLRLADEAEQRMRELEFANRELESFSYSVSHDLRGPVRAIEGFSRILEEEHLRESDAEAKRVLGVVRKNALRLGTLIDDLLDFSRLGRKALTTSDVDMEPIVREAVEDACRMEPDRSYDVRVGPLPRAYADPGLIEQVWRNLIGNAVKYSRGRTPAIVEIDGAVQGHEIVYRVRDNGVGFDMRYAAKLFGVFQRMHKASEFEGTGVGLALVDRIVRRHGGRVWAEAIPDRGASFYFALPTDSGPRSGRRAMSAAPREGTR